MMRSPSMASDPRGQRVTILTHCKSQRIGLSEWQGFRASLPSTAWCTHLPFWIWSACRFCLVFHVGRNDDRVPALSVWVFPLDRKCSEERIGISMKHWSALHQKQLSDKRAKTMKRHIFLLVKSYVRLILSSLMASCIADEAKGM